jgi:lipopolysaccharide transport system ATP-binding protein
VLFVSHNMSAIKSLCKTGILLTSGRVSMTGDVSRVIYAYQSLMREGSGERSASTKALVYSLDNIHVIGRTGPSISSHEPFVASVTLSAPNALPGYYLFCIIRDQMGGTIVHSRVDEKLFVGNIQAGSHTIRVEFPPLWLSPGVYTIQFKLMILGAERADRCFSDPHMLEVNSDSNTSDTVGILCPNINWRFDPQ